MAAKGHHNEGGKSSFKIVDTPTLFKTLKLQQGITFVDIGCGKGEYSLAAAQLIGENGKVIAVDQWEDGIIQLREEAQKQGLEMIEGHVGDVSKEIPADDQSVDIGFMGAVLHGLIANDIFEGTMKEVLRVLKPGGLLAITEWRKIEGHPGPSINIRLSENEVEQRMNPFGFVKENIAELGPYFYLITMRLA